MNEEQNKAEVEMSSEKLIGLFSLAELLRWVLAGGIALFTVIVCYHPIPGMALGALLEPAQLPVVLGASFLVGAITYTLHRCALHPVIIVVATLILRWSRRIDFKWAELVPWWVSKYEEKFYERAWHRQHGKLAAESLREWASQIHFLFCAAWTLLFVRGLGAMIMGALYGRVTSNLDLLSIADTSIVVLLGTGFISNLRMIDMEARLTRMLRNQKAGAEKGS